jgi:hypothetical protein
MATRQKSTRPTPVRRKPASGRPAPTPRPEKPAQPAAKAAPEPAAKPAQPAGEAAPEPAAPTAASRPPAALRVSAAAQFIEAAGLAVAAVFAAVATADGHSYQIGSGIALTLIAVGTAAGVAAIATGLARVRPWSRTPAAMVQLFMIIGGITLLDGHRPEWGVPALVLAVICVAGLLTPTSLRALNRPPRS